MLFFVPPTSYYEHKHILEQTLMQRYTTAFSPRVTYLYICRVAVPELYSCCCTKT